MKGLFFAHILLVLAVITAPGSEFASYKRNPLPVAKWPGVENLPGKGNVADYELFHAAWAYGRTDFWNHREENKHAIVFLGDSITKGWNSLSSDFSQFKVANRGINADTTRGVWYRLKEDVLDLDPEAVVLLIGTNDIGLGTDPKDAAENLKGILAALKKHDPKMPVIVCKVMPSDPSKARPAEKIQTFNKLVDGIIKGDDQFIRCDTWTIFANKHGNATTGEFPDLLHPNADGYAKWKAALDPILAKLKEKAVISSASSK